MNEATIKIIQQTDYERFKWLEEFLRYQQGYAGLFYLEEDLTPLNNDERVIFYDYSWILPFSNTQHTSFTDLVSIFHCACLQNLGGARSCVLRKNHQGPCVSWDPINGLNQIGRSPFLT